ncbi:MAG: HAD family hydrolase [Lachnospiraceae bacterium]|nr:HAD family hydrolase [Ruminococcus sp.]MCM1273779.1 HAD family hydrolase [Lachnospiraceae bacterium]
MIKGAEWLFFDVGWTLVNEDAAFKDRIRKIAEAANDAYDDVYETALDFYKQNKKGDREAAKLLGVSLPLWQKEYETPYENAAQCLEFFSRKYKIGVIANQSLGTERRLENYGLLQYIDLIAASAEEGVEKPDKRIFEIALNRSGCKARDAVMIGDRIDNDIVPANSLGMHTVWVRQSVWRYWSIKNKIEMPEYTTDSLDGLYGVL